MPCLVKDLYWYKWKIINLSTKQKKFLINIIINEFNNRCVSYNSSWIVPVICHVPVPGLLRRRESSPFFFYNFPRWRIFLGVVGFVGRCRHRLYGKKLFSINACQNLMRIFFYFFFPSEINLFLINYNVWATVGVFIV